MSQDLAGLLPAVPYLKNPEGEAPYLEGSRCSKCDAVFIGERAICSSCGSRDSLKTEHLSNKGKLYVFSIVHRSFPGIEVPYISAVVDLEGGGTVKGNLINATPEPEKLPFDMPVEVVYEKAPRKDKEGNEYVTYYFQPAS